MSTSTSTAASSGAWPGRSRWQLAALGTGLMIAVGTLVALLVADVVVAQLVLGVGAFLGSALFVALLWPRIRQLRRADQDWGTPGEIAQVSSALSAAARGRTTPLPAVQHRRAVEAAHRSERLTGGDPAAWRTVFALSLLVSGVLQFQLDPSTARIIGGVLAILGTGVVLAVDIGAAVARRRTRAVLASPDSIAPEGPEPP